MQRLILLAVAHRLPAWAEAACTDYLSRMPKGHAVKRSTVRPEPADGARNAAQRLAAEAKRIRAALPRDARLVALDQRGRDLTTAEFAKRLQGWIDSGQPTAFLIGSADGLDAELKRSGEAIRVSSMTLPHALAQVLVCEQLYRAASLSSGHPYHRE